MTHEEALTVLPSYALGAFDGDVDALHEHLESCLVCSEQLRQLLGATTLLAEAVPMLDPPARLRTSMLASDAVLKADRRYRRRRYRPLAGLILPAAAVLILVIGLTGHSLQQQRLLDATQAALALDGQGLALLTSTATTVQRLEPVIPFGPSTQAHGHWYHRPGIQTLVLVAEFMPPPPAGEAYYGWLQRADGAIEASGRFTLDRQGYGRLILLGHDGTDVNAAIITLQSIGSGMAPGQVVLRWAQG